ncbi:bifunctional 4-hydroxy-2-oxoglutarate aldolase/2-dehydro-3-deoxy-phosphogluconate aldolase [Enterovirga rhinocerotis]|uniref:2-dehydro-3-deoxy-phosphogluconate aldolase n=1 Tax=Enterovirga rhinocerotis TaxID=1339210 RepID=A0A4R7BKZ1_9HYPH|nr:bifunctional 4-hydroxy-2-oxoglutarate aldolase/2-dehydro-3-deoxy-phosphogluconate aldolase [Enterovirga rhinocerotis]TDR84547.1 2-dehydro-3-deoxyphosphogluconate aldolase/(4S)-4-hydroxy-2-oxoglutarate aldolase [Enterovirga rhinocerotis]
MSHADLVARYAALAPAIPVLTILDAEDAVPLARTLVEAGLPVAEVTLRTPAALDAIERIAREVPEAVVAAGTVTRPDQIATVARAGARMIVTPGTPPSLAAALAVGALPAMPGCATVTEALALAAQGFTHLKFFPAGAAGGPAWLKAVLGPCPELRFCPTGGIDAGSAAAYLALPNVACIGGSWMVPNDAVRARDWCRIGSLARDAAALPRS